MGNIDITIWNRFTKCKHCCSSSAYYFYQRGALRDTAGVVEYNYQICGSISCDYAGDTTSMCASWTFSDGSGDNNYFASCGSTSTETFFLDGSFVISNKDIENSHFTLFFREWRTVRSVY